jgi:hypothetical protein
MTDRNGVDPRQARRVFLDTDSLTMWDHHVSQRFPQAQKVPLSGLEPGSTGDWDAGGSASMGTVIKDDDGLLRMWYYGLRLPSNYKENADRPLACYAESRDGIHWVKPDLKITGRNRFPGNNLLPLPGVPASVVRTLPGSDAKYLACLIQYADRLEPDVQDVPGNPDSLRGGNGTHIWASDDGLHWRHVTRLFAHGDNACLLADPATGRYLLYHKVGGMSGLTSRRMWIAVESPDGKRWEGYNGVRRWREVFVCDDYDDLAAQSRGFLLGELYNAGVYRAGEILVAAQTVMDTGVPLREEFAQNPAGLCHARLGFSHDGFNWRYPKGRPAWLERGAPGEPDSGWIMGFSSLVEHGDDLFFYYGASPFDHDWCINPNFTLNAAIPLEEHRRGAISGMMARIKRDRFASLAAVWKGCFDVDAGHRYGDELLVNAQAKNGSVRVALAEKEGDWHGGRRKHDHLPGFSFDDCIPIDGDPIRAPVRFRNARLASIPPELPLTVRFELNRAEVFAYEWGQEEGR